VLSLLVAGAGAVDARPIDCRLGSIAFERTAYVIDIARPQANIIARVVPGWSRDPMFDWIPNDIARPVLYQDPQLLGIVWSSSNPSIVAIDRNGRLTAAAVGTATITARVAGITSQSANVSVVALATKSVLVSTGDVLGQTAHAVDLRLNKATRALRPETIIVTGDGALVTRLVDAQRAPAHTLRFGIAPAAMEDALAAGSIAPPAAPSCV
jgi:hypothetical protein